MRRSLCVAILILVIAGPTASAQDTARMQQVIQSYVTAGTFMGAVLVARDGAAILDNAYGMANLELDVANTPDTKFRLGSLTKQFTAASILLLEERGQLKLEDRLTTYLPDAPPAWQRITIFNLLTHTSGLPNFTAFSDYNSVKLSARTASAAVAALRDRDLDFGPGEKMSYSNSGYVVLGAIIEKVTGLSYEKFVTDNLFTPLGTHDLLKWEQALFAGKVVTQASLDRMTTPFKNDYAFGLISVAKDGRHVIWHNGGIDGFNTYMAFYPDTRIVVIVLSNVNGPVPDRLGAQLGAIAHGDKTQR